MFVGRREPHSSVSAGCVEGCLRRMIHSPRCFVYLVIIGLSVTVWTGECTARPEVQVLHRKTRQACSHGSFQCSSGGCIDNGLLCNGVAECSDSSDETAETCQGLTCSPFAFKCSYGACVDGSAKCNGKRDCLDNSDESQCSPVVDTGNCKQQEFSCNSGECIAATLMCDGRKDCSDGSDETSATCSKFSCNPLAFRCDYGACIDADKECDGQVQCADQSDERPARCGDLPGSCNLPVKPKNGRYTVSNCQGSVACQAIPGTSVKESTLINLECEERYKPGGLYPLSVCTNGRWNPDPSICVQATCNPLSSKSLDIKCSINRRTVSCNDPVAVGTEAEFDCTTGYQKLTEPGYKTIRCLANGQWDNVLYNCNAVCGKRIPKGQLQISNAQAAEVGEFPWHTAIYELKAKGQVQICGGSLISTKFIISAAHCFWDTSIQGLKDKKFYTVAVGKFYRSFAENEEEKQTREVAAIFAPESYRHKQRHYAGDIALLVVNVEVELTWAVQPICIDWDSSKEREQLSSNQFGSVAGWGITENNTPSNELKTAKLPYIDFTTCYDKVPSTFQAYITNDKFCGGYENGTSVCPGDSGGGLVFENRALNVWYLRGIVSAGVSAAKGERCTIDKYTVFTMVSTYISWIKESMENYRPQR